MVDSTGWASFEWEFWECADLVRTEKDAPDSLAKRLSDRTINDEINGRIENEEKVVERDQDQESGRVGETVLFSTKFVVFLCALIWMQCLKNKIK